jgi:polar amino acid transport system substrate-binding protein
VTALDLDAVRAELAPGGTLRVGLNLSNFLLVTDGASGGAPTGIVPDLAAGIAARLGVDLAWVRYPDAGLLSAGAAGERAADAWDVAFMGAEPARAKLIAFTAAYVEIDATYLVRADSPLLAVEDVDRAGVRIAAAARAAYTLYLQRTLRYAELVSAEGLEGSFRRFSDGRLEALAGLRPRLLQDVERLPGARILPGRFTAVQQAIATPVGRPRAFAFLREFAEAARSDGTVAGLIARHGVRGLSVAGPGD